MPTATAPAADGSTYLTFETAARHATVNVPVVDPTNRVDDVRAGLAGRRFDSASHIVVCSSGRFAGIVTIEDLICAPGDATIESCMDREAPVVAPGIDQEIAAWRAVRHGESALAVVDGTGAFAGLIPPHRVMAVLLSEHEEDLSRLGGFLKNSSTARVTSEEPATRRFWHRLPWLVLGLGGALVTADLVGRFEHQLQLHLMLAFFMPGIVYIADAVGTQTETIIVRGLSLGVPMRRMVGRELVAVVAIGCALGAITGPLVWWHWGDARLALSVAVSVLVASTMATIVGIVLPWMFQWFKLDPAVGSGPLATVIQDLLSIWTYLVIATLLI